ncbi:hypothetical protein OG223_02605 [Streptomyces sp. NBC_01478]|uniref:hypothetical protein n=1 Tax=Streptomyces sp. NBC_01478 TaxID=2903882 RepID=UPI002E2FF5EB|nr:hypothetical protein [Streptomyces sp. NBC_01478]
MPRLRTVLNRTVLALVGLLLLAIAGHVLTLAPWAPHLPAPWHRPGPHAVLLNADRLPGLRTHGWWTPTVLAGSIATTAMFALWCARQLRSGARPTVPLSAPDSALRTRALEDAVTHQAVAIAGVAGCRTRLLRRRNHLQVRMHVWLHPDTTPAGVLPALTILADRTESALAPHTVRTQVRLSARSHRGRRIR